MKTKPSGGRPSKPPERRRSATICVRFLPAEADIIWSLALERTVALGRDVSASEIVRSLVRQQLEGTRKFPTRAGV